MKSVNSPPGNLELEQAIELILSAVPAPSMEIVSTADSSGRYLAAPAIAEVSLPGFDNSSMDGYAVISRDTSAANPEKPATLKMVGRIEAGNLAAKSLAPGECMRIFTGSPMPPEADAVVMQEDTSTDPANPDSIRILDKVSPWENVRLAGEDVRKGDPLCQQGVKISAALIALLQASGAPEISVTKRPTVAILATGSELIESGQSLPPGKIYESNRAMLASLAIRAGAVAQIMPLVKDSLSETSSALREAFSRYDMVITSGGVSVGEMDFVKPAFEQMGGKLEFWKVAIKPGRPFVFGKLGNKLLMGLPGNPVSAFVTFLLLVRPAILRWQSSAETCLQMETGTLADDVWNDGGRRHFFRVRKDAQGKIHPAGAQASHMLSSMASANALLDIPPQSRWEKGRTVSVLVW